MDQSIPNANLLQTEVNPLIRRARVPGESFTLPSGGTFYTNGELHPDCIGGEVHVYPMSAIDELVMKSKDKIFTGAAVKEVFARCIPAVQQPGALSAKDVDFLLTALRKVSYGPTFDLTFTHNCDDAKEHTYQVALDSFLRGVKRINPTAIRAKFEFKLENGQLIKFKPATYDDIVAIYQHQYMNFAGEEITNQQILDDLMNSISALIDNVDGVSERKHIIEWLQSIPIAWLQKISDAAKDTTDWGISFDVPLKCNDCGADVVVPTNLNPISFFI